MTMAETETATATETPAGHHKWSGWRLFAGTSTATAAIDMTADNTSGTTNDGLTSPPAIEPSTSFFRRGFSLSGITTTTTINGRHSSSSHSSSSSGGGHSHSDASDASAGSEEDDEGTLMWEAQTALITHEYRLAVRKLKKAVSCGSPAACLSLANILSKGLSCREQHGKDKGHQTMRPNIAQAAKYLIKGLELEHKRTSSAEAAHTHNPNDVDDVFSEAYDTPDVPELNIELLLDLSSSLCAMYRHGKLRSPLVKGQAPPVRLNSMGEIVDATSRHTVDKGKRRQTYPVEKPSHGRNKDDEVHSLLWTSGGDIARTLSERIERVLGIHAEAHEMPRCDAKQDSPTVTKSAFTRSPTTESSHTNDARHRPPAVKKIVSFSQLPPKLQRSSLDAFSARQARAVLIYLYYIAALVAFSQTDNDTARVFWENIVTLGNARRDSGQSSMHNSNSSSSLREAEELISKAKIRIDMLDSATHAVLAVSPTDLRTPLEQPASSHLDGLQYFARHGHPTRQPSRDRAQLDLSKSLDSHMNGLKPPVSAPAQLSETSKQQPPPKRAHAKFAIPDSPASSIHSRQGSSTSIPSINAQSSSHLKAPWPLRRPSSSTSLTLRPVELGPSHRYSSAPIVMHRKSPLGSPSKPKRAKLPALRYTMACKGGERWTARSTSGAMTQISDVSSDSLMPAVDERMVNLKKNDASIASVPHLSTTSACPSSVDVQRSASFADLLFRGRGLRESTASSASLLSQGVRKSFASLRSFFVSAPASGQQHRSALAEEIVDDDDEDSQSSNGSTRHMAPEDEEVVVEDKAEIVKQALIEVGRRHDDAYAEMQEQLEFWKTASDEESPEASPAPEHDVEDDGNVENTPPTSIETIDDAKTSPATLARVRQASGDTILSSPTRPHLPLSISIPSSSLLPTVGMIGKIPANPPPTPTRVARIAEETDDLSTTLKANRQLSLGGPSALRRGLVASPNGEHSSSDSESDENNPSSKTSKAVPIDPLLAALEAASRVNVKSRCAVCAKQGINFPKCQKCDTAFCSRDCRLASDTHACVRA